MGITLAGVCLALGIWQLERANEKKIMLQNIIRNINSPVLSLNTDDVSNSLFREVSATGIYLSDKTFFLDNVMYEGQAGYHVITPFKLNGINKVVLVNRGWISAKGDRRILPEISTRTDELYLKGRLVAPRTKPMFISAEQDGEQNVRLYLDIERIQQAVLFPVLPWVLELNQGSEQGLIQNEMKVDDSKIMMHYAYAIQWFAFSFFALLLFVYACFKQRDDKNE